MSIIQNPFPHLRPHRESPAAVLVVWRALAVMVMIVAAVVSSNTDVDADANEGSPGVRRGAASAISAGGIHSCALLSEGNVKCWGDGQFGKLGQGSIVDIGNDPGEMGDILAPVALGTGRSATAITTGYGHSCSLLDNGAVKCWGSGGFGQLGRGNIINIGDDPGEMGDNLGPVALGAGRSATAVAAGSVHSCALLDNGAVKCWGFGGSGQLGQGSTNTIGDGANEMGDNLVSVALGTGRSATAITAGDSHTCALLDNATVKCWGYGGEGQLGQGAANTIGDGAGEMGDNLAPVALGTGRSATAVTAGGLHTCALLDNGAVKCWGSGGSGRLGQGTTNTIGDGANEMGDNLVSVALGTGRTATSVSASNGHTCALLENATVKCWGNGGDGRLGQGDVNTIGDEANEMGDFLPPVNVGIGRTATAVTTGNVHTCASLDNGAVKCWGYGGDGRLGQGTTNTIGDGPGEMGNALLAIVLGAGAGSLVSPVVATPGAPVGVSGVAGELSVALTWTAPSSDGGASITGYRVEISTDAGLTWSPVPDTGGAATTRTIGGLAPSQLAQFRVAAINSRGVGVVSLPSAPIAPLPATPPIPPPPPGPGYLSLNPARLLDTRPDGATIDGLFHPGVKLVGGQEISLQVTGRGGVPAGAAAVVLNVTVTEPDGPGFITAYPCGTTRPNASNVNFTAGQTIPNNVIVTVGAAGAVCLFSSQTTHLIADINGAFP